MYKIGLLIPFVLSFMIHAQMEQYLEKRTIDCDIGPFLVGIEFKDTVQIDFTLEDSERFQFNSILGKNIERATGVKYNIIKTSELADFKRCINQRFVIARLDKYQEEYVGGGERSGHITVTLLFFNNPTDSVPAKTVSASATGRSDYGHSNPLEYAMDNVGRALRDKLR